ncbi:hypothetical protein GYH30_024446 [Glycine max]|nr:hypothetical protein GYH30_024446 [Glycine max]
MPIKSLAKLILVKSRISSIIFAGISSIMLCKIKNLKYYFCRNHKYHAVCIRQQYEKWNLILKYIYNRNWYWSYTTVIVFFCTSLYYAGNQNAKLQQTRELFNSINTKAKAANLFPI